MLRALTQSKLPISPTFDTLNVTGAARFRLGLSVQETSTDPAYQITVEESNTVFMNSATSLWRVGFRLPGRSAREAGCLFTFINHSPFGLSVTCYGGYHIQDGAGATGTTVTTTGDGACISLLNVGKDKFKYVVISSTGSWDYT